MDLKIVSGFFIGFPKKFKGYIIYCPNHKLRIVEIRNVKFIKDDMISGSTFVEDKTIHEVRITISLSRNNTDKVNSSHVEPLNTEGPPLVVETINDEEPQSSQLPDEIIVNEEIVE